MYGSALAPLALGGLLATPLGTLLVAIVALAVVVLTGRLVLSLVWKILAVAGLVVGILYILSVPL